MALCRWSSMNWSCDLYIYEGYNFPEIIEEDLE
jgi:hypothetical protein